MKKRLSILLIAVVALLTVCVALAPNTEAAATAEQLNAPVTGTKTITQDTVLDLNGYSVNILSVNRGVTVTIKDSATDDYDVANGAYGKINEITGNGTVQAETGYLAIVENNVTSYHKLLLKVSGIGLRANNLDTDGVGLYYQCTFGGDQVVKQNLISYGVAMGANREPDFSDATYTKKDVQAGWVTGGEFSGNSTLLQGIMKTSKTQSTNKYSSGIAIYCQPYVQLADTTRITGTSISFSLKDVVEGTDTLKGVDDYWDSLPNDQKTAAQNFYNSFKGIVNTWSVPQIRQSVTGGSYQIHQAKDMDMIVDKPEANYILMKNIDMQDVDWTPVPKFSGTFDGNNKTISNVTVNSGSVDYIGMFTQINQEGNIFDLNLENITVDACGTNARFVGTIAGLHYGTINNCTVTGVILHDRKATEEKNVFLGAFVGRAMSDSVTVGGTSLSVQNEVTDVNGKTVVYTTTGLCAKVKMNAPDSKYMCRRLVGNYPVSEDKKILCTMSGDWQDLSFSSEDDSAIVQSRRKAAVAAMVDMATVKWTVPNINSDTNTPDLIHYGTTDEAKKEKHVHTQRFYDYEVYYGIPYNHTSSSYEQFMHYMDEGIDGVYVLNEEAASAGNSTWGVTQSDAFGNQVTQSFTTYIGNDCSGAVAWGWHHAVPRWLERNGVYVLLSSNMIPTDEAETKYGLYRIGWYTVTDDMTATVEGKDVITTPAIAEANGTGTIYEAYARAQMGDGLIYGEPGGHARMLAQDSVVIRNPQGSIYSSKSYILTHEQGDGLYDRATTKSSWRINYQYTFYELYHGTTSPKKSSGKGYLPITLKAYDSDDYIVATKPNEFERVENPGSGQINAVNRILCATVVVKDSSGNVVYEKTAYKGSNGLYNAYRSTYLTMIMKYYFSDYVNYVQSGETYTFSVDCTVAGGTLNEDGTISNTTANVVENRSFTAA